MTRTRKEPELESGGWIIAGQFTFGGKDLFYVQVDHGDVTRATEVYPTLEEQSLAIVRELSNSDPGEEWRVMGQFDATAITKIGEALAPDFMRGIQLDVWGEP